MNKTDNLNKLEYRKRITKQISEYFSAIKFASELRTIIIFLIIGLFISIDLLNLQVIHRDDLINEILFIVVFSIIPPLLFEMGKFIFFLSSIPFRLFSQQLERISSLQKSLGINEYAKPLIIDVSGYTEVVNSATYIGIKIINRGQEKVEFLSGVVRNISSVNNDLVSMNWSKSLQWGTAREKKVIRKRSYYLLNQTNMDLRSTYCLYLLSFQFLKEYLLA
jgi:hypothetical protein